MEDWSEKAIRNNCPHCDLASHAFEFGLETTENFHIICDANPISEGHILIIPKQHVACIGNLPPQLYKEFLILNKKVSQFLLKEYKMVSSFEHGIFGQTVFHSHVHYLPFNGRPTNIVPEERKLSKLTNLNQIQTLLKRDKGYLFFSIGDKLWSVDVSLAAPRFFRDRFAKALGRPERGNWKEMRTNRNIMIQAAKDNINTQKKWKKRNPLLALQGDALQG